MSRKPLNFPPLPFSSYLRDMVNLDVLSRGIWQALGTVIGDSELEKIMHLYDMEKETYMNYVTQYIDKCNYELYKASVDKRKDKLRNIAKRIIRKPPAYYSLEEDLKEEAKEYNTTIHELELMDLVYADEVEW